MTKFTPTKMVKAAIREDRPYLVKVDKYTYFVAYASFWDGTVYFVDPKTDRDYTFRDIEAIYCIEEE